MPGPLSARAAALCEAIARMRGKMCREYPTRHLPLPHQRLVLIEIEQLPQERSAPTSFKYIALVLFVIPASAEGLIPLIGFFALPRGHRGEALRARALDDFVEFAAVQPDAATLRAIIDFYALPVCHLQLDLTRRTLHLSFLL